MWVCQKQNGKQTKKKNSYIKLIVCIKCNQFKYNSYVQLYAVFIQFFIYTCTIERQREGKHVYYLLETSN